MLHETFRRTPSCFFFDQDRQEKLKQHDKDKIHRENQIHIYTVLSRVNRTLTWFTTLRKPMENERAVYSGNFCMC